MPARVAVASTLFVLMTCLIAPLQLHAQVIAGRVLEAGSGTPVAGAQLRLLAANGSERGAVVTDSSGWFQVTLPNAGRYSLAVEHIGYARHYELCGVFETHPSEFMMLGAPELGIHA